MEGILRKGGEIRHNYLILTYTVFNKWYKLWENSN